MFWIIAFAAALAVVGIWMLRSKPPKGWTPSENGNPMRITNGKRITVFERDGGWKFCIANENGDDDPYFSDAYETEHAARTEAVAWMNGSPTTYQTINDIRYERRLSRENQRHTEAILECSAAVKSMTKEIPDLLSSPDINITKLRPIERQIEKVAKNLQRAEDHFRIEENASQVETAERLSTLLVALRSSVDSKIAWLQKTPKSQR